MDFKKLKKIYMEAKKKVKNSKVRNKLKTKNLNV